MSDGRAITLRLDSRLENIPLASVAVKAMAGEVGFPREECERLELCVVEALTNVIQHAYQGAAGHPVTLAVAVTGEELELRLHDEGAPMPDGLLERPEPEEATDIQALAESGRGLFLMRRIAGRLHYHHGPEGNTLVLAWRLPQGRV
ncbi:MAG TPA: ATP-binding protein [Archangium sp.]|nr:ATP-binding protein [Archangium sp.]